MPAEPPRDAAEPRDTAAATVRPAGDAAVLIELADGDAALAVAAAVRGALGGRVLDVVPGHRTVLVRWDPARPPEADWAALAAGASPLEAYAGDLVELAVHYDGDDLDAVAHATGLSVAEVVRRHAAPVYRVAFVGFAPGFAYLTGGDPALALPRRATPRDRVPANSVAIAGPYAAVYPAALPGGWHLLGRTDVAVFDAERDPPALLAPGTRVRFVAR